MNNKVKFTAFTSMIVFLFLAVFITGCGNSHDDNTTSDKQNRVTSENSDVSDIADTQTITDITTAENTQTTEATQTTEITSKQPETTVAPDIVPSDYSGLIAWFDANDIALSDAQGVSQWQNKADSSMNAIQDDTQKQPVYKAKSGINSKAGVVFDSTSYLKLVSSEELSLENFTVITVVRLNDILAGGDSNQIFSKLASDSPWNHNWYFNINQSGKFNFGWKSLNGSYNDYLSDSVAVVVDTDYILCGMKDGSAGTLFINGASKGNLVSAQSETVGNDEAVYIGAGPFIGQSLNGTVCEIIMYNRSMEKTEMNELQKYLSKKWEIALQADESDAEIAINVGNEEIREFSIGQKTYKRVLEYGTVNAPKVSATCKINGKDATVTVTQATLLPGNASIYIKELNKTYTVSFRVSSENYAGLSSPSIDDVTINDEFWTEKLGLLSTTTVEYVIDELVKQGAIRNFEKVISGSGTPENNPWLDGLLFETITGASDFLAVKSDPALKTKIDSLIDVVYKASLTSENGYLSTHAMLEKTGLYFDATGNARWYHDAYNFGCMAEAGVHYYLATGETKLLYVAVRYAEFLVENYGYGKINMVPSHSLPEETLIMLYVTLRDTDGLVQQLETYSDKYTLDIDIEEYADLVKFWIENRGNYTNRVNGATYNVYAQDHAYYFDQTIAAGHAVRANLYYTGMAAAGVEFKNYTYLETAKELWRNIVDKQMYITGGVGAHGADEAYGDNYDLPNDGYCETCAQAAMALFSGYMQNSFENACYGDVLENYIYNGILGGVGADGETFFYTQPLNSYNHMRWEWHSCPCCPPMMLKFYSRLWQYIYSFNDEKVYVNQFISSNATLGNGVSIEQTTEMPWGGKTVFTVNGKDTELYIRIPLWTDSDRTTVKVNGSPYAYTVKNGYAVVSVKSGDSIEFSVPVEARRVYSDENVKVNEGKVALAYGPFVYCVESTDNMAITGIKSSDESFAITPDTGISAKYRADLLGGIYVIEFTAQYGSSQTAVGYAVPFYARANRGSSSTYVWINEEYKDSGLKEQKFLAKSTSTDNIGNSAAAAFDGDKNTAWIAGSSDMPQYIVVDLEGKFNVGSVKVFFNSAQAWKFNVLCSDDAVIWQTFADYSKNADSLSEYLAQGNVNTRYIAIEFTETGVGYVTIPEIEVYEYGKNVNIARNKMCGASSASDLGMSAFALFDGSVHTRYCPKGEAKPQSVTMDIGCDIDIFSIKVFFEKHTDWTYKIEFSSDGISWKTYVSETYSGTERVTAKNANCRYLKFTVTATTGGVWGSAWEISIATDSTINDVFTLLKNRQG